MDHQVVAMAGNCCYVEGAANAGWFISNSLYVRSSISSAMFWPLVRKAIAGWNVAGRFVYRFLEGYVMSNMRAELLWFGTVGCLVLLMLGCGPSRGTPTAVSGSVTVDGQPLAGAPLAFHALGEGPAEHRTFTAVTDSSGQYKIEPIYPGTYQVIVIERSGGHEADNEEDILAANPLQPAEGGELRVEIGSDPAVYDIQLVRK